MTNLISFATPARFSSSCAKNRAFKRLEQLMRGSVIPESMRADR
jgi:hypothetical protein